MSALGKQRAVQFLFSLPSLVCALAARRTKKCSMAKGRECSFWKLLRKKALSWLNNVVLRKDMNRTLHRPCHNTWTCAVTRNESQVVLRAGQVSSNQIPAKGCQNPTQSFFWALELVQHCCVSCWGINSCCFPATTEALAVLLDLKANVEDYKVTFSICTSASYFLWQERILPLSLMPSKHRNTILEGLCWWMMIFLKSLCVCSWGGVYQ